MRVAGVADLRALALPWPEHAVYCGREHPLRGLPASKWANPFAMLPFGVRSIEATQRNLTRYEHHVATRPDLVAALPELDGRLLLCFCTTWQGRRPYAGWRCHCDVLADLVAAREPGRPADRAPRRHPAPQPPPEDDW